MSSSSAPPYYDGNIPQVLSVSFGVALLLIGAVFPCCLRFRKRAIQRALEKRQELRKLLQNDPNRMKELVAISSDTSHREVYTSWWSVFQWDVDSTLQSLLGREASVYLAFQKRIIVLLGIVSFLCLVIALPVNVSGNGASSGSTSEGFPQTTVRNIVMDEGKLWVHLILGELIAFLCLYGFLSFHSSAIVEKAVRPPVKVARSSTSLSLSGENRVADAPIREADPVMYGSVIEESFMDESGNPGRQISFEDTVTDSIDILAAQLRLPRRTLIVEGRFSSSSSPFEAAKSLEDRISCILKSPYGIDEDMLGRSPSSLSYQNSLSDGLTSAGIVHVEVVPRMQKYLRILADILSLEDKYRFFDIQQRKFPDRRFEEIVCEWGACGGSSLPCCLADCCCTSNSLRRRFIPKENGACEQRCECDAFLAIEFYLKSISLRQCELDYERKRILHSIGVSCEDVIDIAKYMQLLSIPADSIVRAQRELDERLTESNAVTSGIASCGPVAFVVCSSPEVAKRTLEVYANDPYLSHYHMEYAPAPADIIWENIEVSRSQRLFLEIFWRTLFTFFIIFYSSPLAILTAVQPLANAAVLEDFLSSVREWNEWIGSLLTSYLPTILLLLINLSLPLLIQWVSGFERALSRASYKKSAIIHTFVYLILGTVIMPSLALTTVDALIQKNQDATRFGSLFENMFLPGAGAFFVNYLIQVTFLAAPIDLMRIPETIGLLIRSSTAVTSKQIRDAVAPFTFFYSYEYPYLIVYFSIALVYCVFVPIVAPFGVLYFLFKHWIDRYNFIFHMRRENTYHMMSYTSQFTLKRITHCLCAVVFLFQIVIIGFFSFRAAFAHLVIALLCFALSICVVVWWSVVFYKRIMLKRDSESASKESAPLFSDLIHRNERNVAIPSEDARHSVIDDVGEEETRSSLANKIEDESSSQPNRNPSFDDMASGYSYGSFSEVPDAPTIRSVALDSDAVLFLAENAYRHSTLRCRFHH